MKVRLWRIEFDMGADRKVFYRRCTVDNLDDEIEKLKPECAGYRCIIFQAVDEKLLDVAITWVNNFKNEEKQKKFVIQDRQAGNVIDEFDSLEEAQKALAKYEQDDKNNNAYEPDFYEIMEI